MIKPTLIFFLLWISSSYAQSFSIFGVVTDDNAQPLPYCNISIVNTNLGTTTNADGVYRLTVPDTSITIEFRYIGFSSKKISVCAKSDTVINILLNEQVIHFPELTVTSDQKSEIEQLILSASKQKQKSILLLKTYFCTSYTKSSFRSKEKLEVYGGILEAYSELYFSSPDYFKEIIKSQRQTANIPRSINYLSGDTFLDINADRIVMGPQEIVGPTAPDAIDYYNYEIVDTLYQDKECLLKISFVPETENRPLLEGSMILSTKTFLIRKIDAKLNEKCNYDLYSSIKISQHYMQINDSLLVPYYSQWKSILDLGLPGYPKFAVTKENWRENYRVNEQLALPVETEDKITIKNEFDFPDAPMNIPPLTNDETLAYQRIDSLVTHNKTLKSVTRSLKLLDAYENIRQKPIGDFSDFFRFNRVEGIWGGIAFDTNQHTEPLSIYTGVGYGTADKKMKYFITPTWTKRFANSKLLTSVSLYDQLYTRETYFYYPEWLNTLSSAFAGTDRYDYYYSRGQQFSLNFVNKNVNTKLSILDEMHDQADRNIDHGLSSRLFRDNMIIEPGRHTGLKAKFSYSTAAYRSSSIFRKFIPNQRFIELEAEYELGLNSWGGDFDFHRVLASARFRRNIFSRFLLDVILNAGYAQTSTPEQKRFTLTTSDSWYNQFKSFSTLSPTQASGRFKYELFTELNCNDLFFSLMQKRLDRWELLFIFNNGYISDSNFSFKNILDSYSEAGIGINKIFGLFKLEFIWALHQAKADKNYSINFKIDSFDIF